jgi:hypothetical protein
MDVALPPQVLVSEAADMLAPGGLIALEVSFSFLLHMIRDPVWYMGRAA